MSDRGTEDLLGMIACLQVGIDPRNCYDGPSTAREIEIASGGRGLGHLLSKVTKNDPPAAKMVAPVAPPVTSLDTLIAGGMLPPGLATQVIRVPK